MQGIADWLKKLGMSEYVERFAEEHIEIDVLPELTDQDLERLGIPLGQCRRMLRAIRELGGPASSQTAAAIEPIRRDDAERCQLTVMFCDLVGSTALSTKLYPEDLRSVIGAYHKCVAETVARFDGFVAKSMGDGVLIYFSYPHAHEDDGACWRAGLALIEAVGKLRTQEPLQVRIGVATGLVVVGDLVGSGAGTWGCGRDAEPGGTPAGDGRAELSRHRRGGLNSFSATVSSCRISSRKNSRDRRDGAGRRDQGK